MKITDDKIINFLKDYWKQLFIAIGVLFTLKILATFINMDPWYHLFITIPYLIFVFIFISLYVKFQKHQSFVIEGVRFYRNELFAKVAQYLMTKTHVSCLSCGGSSVSVKGISRFTIDAIAKPQKGGAVLVTAVIGCDDCGFIQQHNLPLSLFENDKGDP